MSTACPLKFYLGRLLSRFATITRYLKHCQNILRSYPDALFLKGCASVTGVFHGTLHAIALFVVVYNVISPTVSVIKCCALVLHASAAMCSLKMNQHITAHCLNVPRTRRRVILQRELAWSASRLSERSILHFEVKGQVSRPSMSIIQILLLVQNV